MKHLIVLFSYIALSLGASSSLCNPLSSTNCPAETALATDINVDFKSESDYFDVVSTESGVEYGDNGLSLTLSKRFDNPSLKSNFYIMFGRVEVSLKAGNGTGIVSSFYLQSNDLDEIDIELLGGDSTQWQSNYFVKGNTTTYDRGEYHDTSGAPQEAYHNYTIDWTNERIVWYFDGTAVRTLKNDSSQGFPQSPMYLMTGIWAGGDSSNAAGTIEWAGGLTDYSDAPFIMYINDLKISDYSSGESYSYTDQSGDWTSIKAKNGKVLGRLNDADTNPTTSSSSKSSSSSATSSSSSSSTSSSSLSSVTNVSTSSAAQSAAENTTTAVLSETSTVAKDVTSSTSKSAATAGTTSSSSSDVIETSSSSSSVPSITTSGDSGASRSFASLISISILLFSIIY